jgi:YscO-like protein
MSAYPLQALLGLREDAKAQAGRALSGAVRTLADEEARRDAQAAALAQARAEHAQQVQAHLDRVLAQGADARALTQWEQHQQGREDALAAQARALAEQEARVGQAQRALEAARAVLVEAARELEVLQQHRERWAQARRHAREAREEQTQEEVGSALFLSRQRK